MRSMVTPRYKTCHNAPLLPGVRVRYEEIAPSPFISLSHIANTNNRQKHEGTKLTLCAVRQNSLQTSLHGSAKSIGFSMTYPGMLSSELKQTLNFEQPNIMWNGIKIVRDDIIK